MVTQCNFVDGKVVDFIPAIVLSLPEKLKLGTTLREGFIISFKFSHYVLFLLALTPFKFTWLQLCFTFQNILNTHRKKLGFKEGSLNKFDKEIVREYTFIILRGAIMIFFFWGGGLATYLNLL